MSKEGKSEEAKGRLKKAAGEVTDDDKMKREGEIDKASGKAKQVVDKANKKLKGEEGN